MNSQEKLTRLHRVLMMVRDYKHRMHRDYKQHIPTVMGARIVCKAVSLIQSEIHTNEKPNIIINFDDVTVKHGQEEHNPHWPQIPDHP